jgi:hypothetical protein
LGIVQESDWLNVTKERLKDVRLPPQWTYVLFQMSICSFVIRLTDVLYLVQEVYQSSKIPKSKSASYKKAQFTLKSMLKTIFPREGIS